MATNSQTPENQLTTKNKHFETLRKEFVLLAEKNGELHYEISQLKTALKSKDDELKNMVKCFSNEKISKERMLKVCQKADFHNKPGDFVEINITSIKSKSFAESKLCTKVYYEHNDILMRHGNIKYGKTDIKTVSVYTEGIYDIKLYIYFESSKGNCKLYIDNITYGNLPFLEKMIEDGFTFDK